MNNGTLIALALGILLGLTAGRFMSGSAPAADAELEAQLGQLSQRLTDLDQRLATRAATAQGLDAQQIAQVVRSALAERGCPAPTPANVASAPAGSVAQVDG